MDYQTKFEFREYAEMMKKRNIQCSRMPKYVTQLKITFRGSHTSHVKAQL